MYIQKQQFHDNPFIDTETGRSITINGSTYKKLVKKYGQVGPCERPKIVANSQKGLIMRTFCLKMMLSIQNLY
jgi:hypothetical protein